MMTEKWTVRDAGNVLLAICETREDANRAADHIEFEFGRECTVTRDDDADESKIGN